MVCLFSTLIFFVGCAGTDPNGNNGDAGNGDTTYYYLPTQNTTVENTKPTIEASPTTDFAPTSYLYENGNVWYGSTTSESGLRTDINNDGGVENHHYIGTSVSIIGYSDGGGTWYETMKSDPDGIPYKGLTEQFDSLPLTTDWENNTEWLFDNTVNVPNHSGSISLLVLPNDLGRGRLGFNIVGDKGNLYLVTETIHNAELSFDLLF